MSEERRYLVIGARGFQGGAVAGLLAREGCPVRGLGGRGASAAAPTAPRIPTVTGDLADPGVVREAFRDVTHASVVFPLVYDRDLIAAYARNVAAAAQEAGVRRIVYNTNTPVPAQATPYAAYETRRLAEEILRAADLPLVILRPPVYLDNLFSPWSGPSLVGEGVLAYPLPADLRVAWLCHADLAAATVAALHRDGIEGRTIAVGGPDALTGDELAAAFAEALGRDVSYLPLDVDRFEAGLREVVGAHAAEGVAGIYRWAARTPDPDLFAPDPAQAAHALGVSLTPVEKWISAQPWHVWATPSAPR